MGISLTIAQFFRGFNIHGDGTSLKRAWRASAGLSGGEESSNCVLLGTWTLPTIFVIKITVYSLRIKKKSGRRVVKAERMVNAKALR